VIELEEVGVDLAELEDDEVDDDVYVIEGVNVGMLVDVRLAIGRVRDVT
jgi:hypothetical protein